jgi:hypothetical protein
MLVDIFLQQLLYLNLLNHQYLQDQDYLVHHLLLQY